jgi:hypothetical protein
VTITLPFDTPNFIKLDAVFIGVSEGQLNRVIVTVGKSEVKVYKLERRAEHSPLLFIYQCYLSIFLLIFLSLSLEKF